MGEPSIRGAQLRANWTVAREMAGEAGIDALVDAVGPEHHATLESCGRLQWVPVEVDLALSRAVEAVLGEGADYERCRRSTTLNMQSPILRPFLDGARRVFGLDPAKTLKLLEPGWSTIFRDCGNASYERVDACTAIFRIDDMPEAMLATPSYVRAFAGSMHGLLDLCRVEGSVEVIEASVEARCLRIQLGWTPR